MAKLYKSAHIHLACSFVIPLIPYSDIIFTLVPNQSTQKKLYNICTKQPNVFDVGPTMYKCYTNISCLLGTRYRFTWVILKLSLHTAVLDKTTEPHKNQLCKITPRVIIVASGTYD